MPSSSHLAVLAAALSLATAAALAQSATPFDGDWKLAVSCPATSENEGAKGYSYYFNGKIEQGHLQFVHGEDGEPGWQSLHGEVTADGKAKLTMDGIVNDPSHAIGNSPKGKRFSYGVLANFEPTSGTGQRTSGRPCELRFTR